MKHHHHHPHSQAKQVAPLQSPVISQKKVIPNRNETFALNSSILKANETSRESRICFQVIASNTLLTKR
jgi:hypothetical protein